MDPNPNRFPILSYILSHLHPPTPKSPEPDIENPNPSSSQSEIQLLNRMPKIHHPDILSSMIHAVSDVSQTRSVLRSLGPRPDHESVDAARSQIAEIDASFIGREDGVEAGAQKLPYDAVIRLDEMHEAYEKLLKEAEERLERMYVSSCGSGGEARAEEGEWNENVVEILREAAVKCVDRVELSGQGIRFLPEDFGRVRGLVCLNVSNNQLEVCGFLNEIACFLREI